MSADALSEAYERLHRTGPEFGGDEEGNHGLTNHGPMAVEVVLRRGLDLDVEHWLDRYVRRLEDAPQPGSNLEREDWRDALGDPRRAGDWTQLFWRSLAERPWEEVLAEWWPRLLPGIAAGSTHGVIRVGHAVRVLRRDPTCPGAHTELAHGLAFWAARYRRLPGVARPAGRLSAAAALGRLPRLPEQTGFIAHRLGRLADLPGWSGALAVLAPPADPAEVPDRLAELVHAGTARYLSTGASSPVLLVHVATAPNAVLHTLPVLPQSLWKDSLTAVWAAAAAITACYADGAPAPLAQPAATADPAADLLDRAARHGDEHVLKFADTAVDVYTRTGDPAALAAGHTAAALLAPATA